MLGFVNGLVSLDKDSCGLAVQGDCGVVMEDVTSLCEVTVPPHFQVGLAS